MLVLGSAIFYFLLIIAGGSAFCLLEEKAKSIAIFICDALERAAICDLSESKEQ